MFRSKEKVQSLQSKAKATAKTIAVFINASSSRMFLDGLARFKDEYRSDLIVQVYYAHEVEEERVDCAWVSRNLAGADLVLLDLRGAGRAVSLAASALCRTENPVVLLVGGAPEMLSLVRMGSFRMADILSRSKEEGQRPGLPSVQRMQDLVQLTERIGNVLPFGKLRHARNWSKAMRYWTAGGSENVCRLLAFLGREYLGLDVPNPAAPVEFSPSGLFNPFSGELATSPEALRAIIPFDPSKPSVGLLIYGGMHYEQSLVGARALAGVLGQSCNLIPVYAETQETLKAMSSYFRGQVDAVVSFRWFQLATFTAEEQDTLQFLQSLDVPVFCPSPMYGREEQVWRESVAGLSPVEVMTAVIMPELDGQIEPLPSIALKETCHPRTGLTFKSPEAVSEQIDLLARRVEKRIALRHKPNAQKKIAFIIYDTPPGEDNIGNASYLDVFASIRKVVKALADRGYTMGELPENGEILRRFVATGAVNNARWVPEEVSLEGAFTMDAARYSDILKGLAKNEELSTSWGEPPGEIMASKDKVILPALAFGNCLLGLQPARGIHSDPETITHDKTLPPHHQYVAFYRWLEEDWGADAVIHVGTHGTLEFLKGKEAGLSASCWPLQLLGGVPHFYIYHCVNASEAMIAKRRSLATIVNYSSPPFVPSGLYEEYADLEGLIAELYEARISDPARAERIEPKIFEIAGTKKLRAKSIEELQEELTLMKRSLIPHGLHVLDEVPGDEELAATVSGWLRQDRDQLPALHRLLAQERGLDWDRLLDEPGGVHFDRPGAAWLDELDALALKTVATTFATEAIPDGSLAATLRFGLDLREKLSQGLEIGNLIRALEGGWTPPGIGGEPGRDPDVLPTGRNSFQFDPRLVPSETAFERGRVIAENTLAYYHATHGHYPKTTAVVLWAFETAKTRGETVGQIFGYLGVRPVRKTPWKTDLEVIPVARLGRPRIDVTVQICGFFRDMFANVISLINRAFGMVSELDEGPEENFVRPHTEAVLATLSETLDRELARKLSVSRVFGPRAGEYGTRVTSLIETSAWQSEEDIVRTYTDSMNHIYADGIHGVRHEEIYSKRMQAVELVSQIRDTIDYEIADLDHYYEYFGGLSSAVEHFRGETPAMLITDTTGEKVRTEEVGVSLERGLRTRLLNPAWIDAMLEHDVHGAQKVSERVQNLIGFSATTRAVPNWVYSAVAERYLFDEVMRRRLSENNPYAAEEITRRLNEATGRGYWNPSQEELEKLREVALELEGDIEEGLDQ